MKYAGGVKSPRRPRVARWQHRGGVALAPADCLGAAAGGRARDGRGRRDTARAAHRLRGRATRHGAASSGVESFMHHRVYFFTSDYLQ
jgi:hypothetical protein